MESPICRLLQLPTEILQYIAFAIRPSLKSLDNFARVCHRLCSISIPVLYNSVLLRSLESTSRFSWTISHSPNFIPLVRELQIHYHDLDEDGDDCPEDFDPTLVKLVHLESLVVRTVWFDHYKARTTSIIRNPSEAFPALRSCNLGNDYGEPWSLRPYDALFTHIGLQKLTISGAHVGLVTAVAPSPRYTKLQELRLLNCDISARNLERMLDYPRNLKHLTLKGQAKDTHFLGGLDDNRSAYIDAIRAHSSSLETLDLDLYIEWFDPIDLRYFKALKKLIIAPRMLIGDDPHAMERRMTRAPAAQWRDILSPNLEHLTLWSDESVFPIMEILELVCSGDLHLSTFTCQMPYDIVDCLVIRSPQDMLSEKCSNGTSVYQNFKELGVHFTVVEISEIRQLPEGKACPCKCWTYMHRFDHGDVW